MTPRRKRSQPLESVEIVKVVDLAPIPMTTGAGDDFRFRVEILRKGRGSFTARVWRLEFYRVQPTFPQEDGRPTSDVADEQVLVVDENFGHDISGASANAVLKKVVRQIEEKFFGRRGACEFVREDAGGGNQ